MSSEIKFDDIRQGDTVRTVRVFGDGFKITLEGVAERLVVSGSELGGDRAWRNGHGGVHCVAMTRVPATCTRQTIYLVKRAEESK
jgi:hypothetical protein